MSDDVIKNVRNFRQNAKELILEKGKCELCGNKGDWNNPLRGHHRIRPTEGGSNDKSNIIVLCESCYRRKILGKKYYSQNSYIYEVVKLTGGMTKVCNKCKKNIRSASTYRKHKIYAIKETNKQNTVLNYYHIKCVDNLSAKGINLKGYDLQDTFWADH